MELWKLKCSSLLIIYTVVQTVFATSKPFQRSSSRRLRYVIFKEELFHALGAETIEVAYVETGKLCLLKCVKNLQCFSTNIGVHPRTDERVRCELLSSDKYRALKSFRANTSFHHYRVSVSQYFKLCLFFFFQFCFVFFIFFLLFSILIFHISQAYLVPVLQLTCRSLLEIVTVKAVLNMTGTSV